MGVTSRTGPLRWFVVVVAGVVVLALVFGLSLYPRLDAGQEVLDAAAPAFTEERVAGDVAGITIVSQITDLADPIMLQSGGAADEVLPLVGFVADQTGLPEADVLGLLTDNFPQTTALLLSLPLESVNDEIPELVAFLAETLGLTEAEVLGAIEENFPRLFQVIVNLDLVVNGWENVEGTEALTRFNGDDVSSVRDVRTYFAEDVVGAVAATQESFRNLESTWPPLDYFPPLLTIIGVVVILLGLLMMWRTWGGERSRTESVLSWSVVLFVGVFVLVIVFGLQLYPRLDDGQQVLDGLRPAFTAERVEGDRAGITIVSQITDLSDPIMLQSGGAADEVLPLVGFVADQTGLPEADVLGLLTDNFPQTTNLLLSLPLESVNDEIPELVAFLAETLGLTDAEVLGAIEENFPRLFQVIVNLDIVVNGWESVEGTEALTRFNGDDVTSVRDVRDYYAEDVIPVLETQQENFQELDTTEPPVDAIPPLLTILGILVIAYGGSMVWIMARRRAAYEPPEDDADADADAEPEEQPFEPAMADTEGDES